jgi:hypothetical protein
MPQSLCSTGFLWFSQLRLYGCMHTFSRLAVHTRMPEQRHKFIAVLTALVLLVELPGKNITLCTWSLFCKISYRSRGTPFGSWSWLSNIFFRTSILTVPTIITFCRIRVPYPFQWGAPTFDAGESFAVMVAAFVALVEVCLRRFTQNWKISVSWLLVF